MTTTLKGDMFVPEVATQVATAQFPSELATGFPGSPFVTGFPPLDSIGDEGDVIKFPRYDPLGDFVEMTEDVALTPERLRTSKDQSVVQVAGKAAEITDFASLSGRGEPSAEVGSQTAALAARYIDRKLTDEGETTPLESSVDQTFTWEVFVDAIINNWGDRAMQNVGGLVVNSKVMGDIMKLPEFKRADMLGTAGSLIRGFIGMIGTYPVFTSDRTTVTAGTPNTYTNLIFKRGALGLMFQRTLLVERDRDILSKNWIIAADVRFSVHLYFGEPMPAIRLITQ